MAIAAIVSLFTLTSCEKEPAELIVGKWVVTSMNINVGGISMDVDPSEMGMNITYTFNADGSATMSEGDAGEEISCNYQVLTSGDKQILSITIEGDSTNFDIQTLDEERLVLYKEETEDGQTIKMTTTLKRA